MSELAAMSCEPCRGGVPPLTPQEAERRLPELDGWSLTDGARRIERRFAFKDFRAALRFVDAAGEIAEAEGHHPDITFGWGYARMSLQTHTIKGLHQNDFILAAKYDRLYLAEAPSGGQPSAAE